jgi:hypothetical protein
MQGAATRHAAALGFAAGALAGLATPAAAQTILPQAVVQARRACDGDTISAINIRSYPPPFAGAVGRLQEAVYARLGIGFEPTRPQVIASYMRLKSGTVCSEVERSESERLLRAQPFIASATIRAVREGPRRSRLEVDVVDEPRLLGAAGTRHGSLSLLALGNENYAGRGVTVVGSVRRGFAYRDGVGMHVVKYGMFGRPDFLAVEAQQLPVMGERLSAELAEPFLTDLQVRAFHARAALRSGYATLVVPSGEQDAIYTRRTSFDAGGVARIGGASGGGPVGLLGAAILGESVRSGRDVVFLADTGLVVRARDPFAAAYPGFTATYLATIVGVRALRFVTARGFDALRAEQDVGVGVQVDGLLGPSLVNRGIARDMLASVHVYAGRGDSTAYAFARGIAEAHLGPMGRAQGVVASARLAWYRQPSVARTRIVSVDGALLRRAALPLQLTLRDYDGGVPGYGNSAWAGGARLVARVEDRRSVRVTPNADVAVAAFAAAGALWAGDAPYGRGTGLRAAVGMSLLGAYPSGDQRTFRLDVAVPFTPERGRRIEFRVSLSDRTRLLWSEPSDVANARTGAIPITLLR